MKELARRFARGWSLDLPRPVLILQAANLVNSLGFGLVVPFEIIYLHQLRGIATPTAGLIVSTVMATGAVAGPPAGALLDRLRPKPVLLAGSVASAGGYGGLAFIDRPWQGFLCSALAGIGFAASITASPTLVSALVTREQRPQVFAAARVALNLGIGTGAVVGGFVVSAGGLHAYQALYLGNALTFLAYGAVVLAALPNIAPHELLGDSSESTPVTFGTVLRNRPFVTLVAANIVLTIVGYSLFASILAPYLKAHTTFGPRVIGLLFLVNTAFIVIAQLPAAQVVRRMRRMRAFAGLSCLWALACLAVLVAAHVTSAALALALLVAMSIGFAVGECMHSIVFGPLIVDIAPPRALGRYMSIGMLSMTIGLALGPTVGARLLALSPNAVWWVGALVSVAVGFGLIALEGRVPESPHALRAEMPSATEVLAES